MNTDSFAGSGNWPPENSVFTAYFKDIFGGTKIFSLR